MIITQLDVRGLPCPQPVLKTKALLDAGRRGPLAVALDNEVSAINVSTFLEGAGFSTQSYRSGREWLVLGRRGGGSNILVWHTPSGWQAALEEDAEEAIIDLTTPLDQMAPMAPMDLGAPLGLGHDSDRRAPLLPGVPADVFEPAPAFAPAPGSRPSEADAAVLAGSQFMGRGDEALGGKLAASFFDTLAGLGRPPRLICFYNSGVMLTTRDSVTLEALKDLARQGADILSSELCLEYYGLREQLKVGRVGGMYDIIKAQRAPQIFRL